VQSFNELTLSEPLIRAIADLGYEKPSPIQAQALPILLGGSTDFLGLAATGTGKTAAFGIPLLERIQTDKRTLQAIVMCPTRELALQVAGQINLLGKHKGVRALPIYGGAGYGDQIYGLKQGATVVVGTPGRIIDHIERGTLKLDGIHTVVLDEADEMISMGFKEDLETIMSGVPRETSNFWLFSATMSREVRKVADEYLRKPQQVQVNRTEMLSTTVEQLYYMTRESDKAEILCKLIESAEDFYGLIFCQTKSLVADLTQYLQDQGYRVDCLHGDKDQKTREKTMQAFRDRKVKILVCTDVASRGLDVQDVTHVINYSIPRELDSYVHRIGRTARSGKAGVAMSLVTPSHRPLIGRIENMTKSRMTEGRIPNRRDIASKKVAKILTRFQDQPTFSRAVELLDPAWKEALAQMSSEEIAGRFLALTFPEIFVERERMRDERPAPRQEQRPRPERTRQPREEHRSAGGRFERREPRAERNDFADRPPRKREYDRDRPPAPARDRFEARDKDTRNPFHKRRANSDNPPGGYDKPARNHASERSHSPITPAASIREEARQRKVGKGAGPRFASNGPSHRRTEVAPPEGGWGTKPRRHRDKSKDFNSWA
jgi:ATP-dependent RNA helicase DeaD